MDTNTIFQALQNARQNKTMKSFVKEIKEQFNIDLSVQGIRSTGHHEGQVYNKFAAFERYAKQEQPTREPRTEPKVNETSSVILPASGQIEVRAEKAKNALVELVNNLHLLNEDKVIQLIDTHRPKINISEIKEIIQDILKDMPMTPTTVVNLNTVKITEVKGITHPQFMNILQVMQAGCYPYIFGPAGSGKTYTARQAATALNLPFYSISLCAQTTEVKLTGYRNATGEYVETSFFKAYTEGGVYCLDEIDNSNPNVVTVLNNALSGETYGFPHGEFTKHKDFRVVATANTIGNGATAQYVGRNPLDKAASDRFEFVKYDYDPVMELSLCNGNKDIYNMVLHARNVLKDTKALISPRATASIYKLTSVGMDIKTAFELSVTNKLTENEKQILLCK